MARLFLSLYVFIALTLVGLSAALEQAFFDDDDQQPPYQQALFDTLAALPGDPQQLLALTQSMGLSPQLLKVSDIAWREDEIQRLAAGDIVPLYSGEHQAQLYRQLDNDGLLELTVTFPARSSPAIWLYSSVFFILLGVLLAIWVWPLWRDLSRLQHTSEQLQPDGSLPHVPVNATSPIAPIADAMARLSDQVQRLLHTQRELTGAVAHEIRTPLARLKFALAMKPTPDSEPWLAMQADLDELETLVQEMLNYTSMDIQEPELSYSEIPLQALCESVVEKVRGSGKLRQQVSIEAAPLSVLADEHFLSRALENLMFNATRFARSRIELAVTADPQGIEISVADDGDGVPAAMAEKIFEPFYRPDGSRNRLSGGAGLGLAIVRRIMLWHKGHCRVENAESGGARFVLWLPRN